MKRMGRSIVVSAAAVLFAAVPLLAAPSCPVSSGEFDRLVQSNMKDQCLIVARNCADESATVQQRVNQLRVEIAKGSYVYTPNELRALKEQLQWIETDSGNGFI
jgi:hypothetical protein